MCRLSALFVSCSRVLRGFSHTLYPALYVLPPTIDLFHHTQPRGTVYARGRRARPSRRSSGPRPRGARRAQRSEYACLSKLNLAGLREQGCQPTHLLFRESVVPLLPITCRTLPCASRGAPSQPPPIGHAPVNNAWVARSSCRGLGPRHLAWDGRVVLHESLETTGNGAQRCNAPNRRSGL